MKNILSSAVILAVLLLVPLVILPLSCKSPAPIPEAPHPTEPPAIVEPIQPVTPPPTPTAPPVNPMPSSTFMKGYWDGWHGVWLGPIRWTFSDDYRQGHMLGSYDRKRNIQRYTPEQR